jgi:BON domain
MPTRTNTDDAASVEVTHSHRDPEVVAKHISMIALDGAVTLAGHVTTIHEKHVAVRAAERVEAVRAIADDIEVRPSSLKGAGRRRDRRGDRPSAALGRRDPRPGRRASPRRARHPVWSGRVGVSARPGRERSPTTHRVTHRRQPDQGRTADRADRHRRRAPRTRGDHADGRPQRTLDPGHDNRRHRGAPWPPPSVIGGRADGPSDGEDGARRHAVESEIVVTAQEDDGL